MKITDSFRDQHKTIAEAVKQLEACLNEAKLKTDATTAANALANLSGKLKVHLSMEDKTLYPMLAGNKDPKVKAIAEKFIAEMGKITPAYMSYADKWKISTIQASPANFITETKNIFNVLADRIRREENELYPLADSLK